MSLDRTLKSKSALVRSRSVLTRAERIAKLEEEERWDASKSVFGLPKVAVLRRRVVKKAKADDAAKDSEQADSTAADAASAEAKSD